MPGVSLGREQLGDGGGRRRRPGVRDEDAQRAAVDREMLHVDDLQPGALEQRDERMRRVIEEVLVVDRVELELVDQVAHVRGLDDRDAVVGEDRGDPFDDAVHVGNVGEHVVRVQHRGAPALRPQLPGDGGSEELTQRRDTVLLRHRRDVAGRVDAEHRDAGLDVVAQEVAVVARDLHREVVRPE